MGMHAGNTGNTGEKRRVMAFSRDMVRLLKCTYAVLLPRVTWGGSGLFSRNLPQFIRVASYGMLC